jgi:hypothetical protein
MGETSPYLQVYSERWGYPDFGLWDFEFLNGVTLPYLTLLKMKIKKKEVEKIENRKGKKKNLIAFKAERVTLPTCPVFPYFILFCFSLHLDL